MLTLVEHLGTRSSGLLVAAALALQAACASAPPRWVTAPPSGYRNDYFVGLAQSSDQREARRLAVREALIQRAEEGDLRIHVSREDRCESRDRAGYGAGARASVLRDCVTVEQVNTDGQTENVRGLQLVETWYDRDYSSWKAYTLLKIPKQHDGHSPPWTIGIVTRSIIVPGWGQSVREERGKAAFFRYGVVLTGAAGTAAMVLREDAIAKIPNTMVQTERDQLVKRANDLRLAQWGGWGVAALLYGINVFDAITSPGKIYVTAPTPSQLGLGVRLAVR